MISGRIWLLDLRLAELDVLLGDRIVLLLRQLVRHGARVLARHVIEAGVGARDELHLDRGGLGHFEPLFEFGRTLAAEPQKSRIRVTAPRARISCAACGRTGRAGRARTLLRRAPAARRAPPA